jgi:hypothetical protein
MCAVDYKSMIGGYRALLVMNSVNPLLIRLSHVTGSIDHPDSILDRESLSFLAALLAAGSSMCVTRCYGVQKKMKHEFVTATNCSESQPGTQNYEQTLDDLGHFDFRFTREDYEEDLEAHFHLGFCRAQI